MRAFALPLLLTALVAQAQDGPRDPTALPAPLRAALATAAPGASAAESALPVVRQVVFADGKAYVVQRGRRHAVGEMLEGARIERITEQAVWLREPGGPLHREPLYGGVEKRPPPAPAASAPRSSQKEKP
jgi:hypothetical protein